MTCQTAVHHRPEPPRGPLAPAMVQTGTTAGDGAPDPALGMGMGMVRVGLRRVLLEAMAMVLDLDPGQDPGTAMDPVVVVLGLVVMGLEVVRETLVTEMVVMTIIISYHHHPGENPTMGKCINTELYS